MLVFVRVALKFLWQSWYRTEEAIKTDIRYGVAVLFQIADNEIYYVWITVYSFYIEPSISLKSSRFILANAATGLAS